ncbi:MAG: sulfite exporter TauE/SafE family protein, partial [Oceanicoccus sp.]|uniref:sulfite exporter TauE/SafE family protein n=1 Tax=Oceanicoccus sp. TaxID=2691044 RepID=UPI00261815FC
LAGGGSLLTLPILIFLGLPTAVANGTNRIAIIAQCGFAVAGFKKKGVSNFKLSLLLSIPAIIGAIIGAYFAVDISDILFKRVLAVIMMLVLGLILWNPAKKRQISGDNPVSLGRRQLITAMTVFFFIGIYGGFIQVGAGFIIIAALTTITKFNLVVTNSHKVFIAGIFTIFALIVFAFNGKVCWEIGLCLAAGMGLGGWIGSHWAVAKGERWIRAVLAICVVAMVIKLIV